MANYMTTSPGNQDIIKRLMALKAQAQLTGQVNPDIAGVVQGSLADERERAYRDAMLGISEKGLTLAQAKQAAQESQFTQSLAQGGQQFADTLALHKQMTEDEIKAAKRRRTMDWINMGVGTGLMGTYLATRKGV